MKNARQLQRGVFLILIAGATGAVHAGGPFEPTVTKEESIVLNTALRIAETNTTPAIRMLTTKELHDASPALDFAIGNLHFQSERLDEAAAAYQAALKKLPKFRGAIMNLGRVYLLQERTSTT